MYLIQDKWHILCNFWYGTFDVKNNIDAIVYTYYNIAIVNDDVGNTENKYYYSFEFGNIVICLLFSMGL